ncbi:hypothetical protein CBR_g4818 [Chara braunii]|uniref:MORN repeat-containing protein 5 n=1 Tax=Chara braunii TaxID=69332 RepID=A0A388KIW2_CHABU|nr:hypothetical protein CBR_g4818 [Chara braunii]|eukprot:GBG69990.1 hypothetical protein CBR_g4818 [Chara braunii]
MASKKGAKPKKIAVTPPVGDPAAEVVQPTIQTGKFYFPNGAIYEGECIVELPPPPPEPVTTKGTPKGSPRKAPGSPRKAPGSPRKAPAKETQKELIREVFKEAYKEGYKEDVMPQKDGAGQTDQDKEKLQKPKRLRHGKGIYTDGNYSYEGEWKNDMMHGQGVFKFASGAVYAGQWNDNQYHGKGKFTVSTEFEIPQDGIENYKQ